MATLLKENELKNKIIEIYREEFNNILSEKWEKLSNKDKRIVVEMLKTIYPKKSKLINESKWYNTVGDIVGIFDPTGVVDLVNGISYWRQGDKLFAILSWVSVIPYLGDVVAKPVVGVLKIGGGATKAFKSAALAGDAAKIAETAKVAGGPIAKMVEKAPSWGGKLVDLLKNSIGRVPGLGRGLVRSVEEYVNIFSKASKELKLPSEVVKGGKLVNVEKGLTALEKETLLKQMAKDQGKMFRGYKDVGNSWLKFMKSDATLGQKFAAGVPRIFGGNPATRSLMRRSKFYLGFLDWLGLGNFVGPDELLTSVPNADEKYQEYLKTQQAQQLWNDEMGGSIPTQTDQSLTDRTGQSIGKGVKQDSAMSLIGSLLGGPAKFVV